MSVTSPSASVSNSDIILSQKSPSVLTTAKESEPESYNCNDRLLQISTHTYSQSSSSQSPSSLPSSRSVVSPQPLTPSSTDSHVSHEKSPSPHRDRTDSDHIPLKISGCSMESESIQEKEAEKSESNVEQENEASSKSNEQCFKKQELSDSNDKTFLDKNNENESEVSKYFSHKFYKEKINFARRNLKKKCFKSKTNFSI